jgi:hypothetical protein
MILLLHVTIPDFFAILFMSFVFLLRLQVKQKHHVRSKWNKNIMSAPSEKKTSGTLQVKRLEIQTI